MRIAMWSGPRNLSTAMMYAFAARPDFAVLDEPFYAAYLLASGADHPMREVVLQSHESDPTKVAGRCVGPIPEGKTNLYMKHMAHHMVPGLPLDWAEECVNVHLIRHPARVIASYAAKRETVTAHDIGYRRHLEIFRQFPGPVVDSDDIRLNPHATLSRLCEVIGLNFDPAMLKWPVGPKPFDGVWAAHWYGAVHDSGGLIASKPTPLPEVPDHHALLDEVLPLFKELAQNRL